MKAQKPKSDPAIAYSYLRFSSPEQAQGDSVRRQTEMSKAWCARNGVKYDEALSLRDEGISAFTGEHRKNPDRHALAGFLELVRQGKVARGSYFVIENLDRLSREDTVPALHLFSGILFSGIKIVQLDPEAVYHDKSDSMDIMRAILELSRGNSESRNKSRRMGAVWGEKRKRAAEAGAVMSRSCPAWLRVEGRGEAARYALVPGRAEVVKRIFRMATEGHGVRRIVKALQNDKVPHFARKPWSTSYVKVILKNPAAFGQFTPRSGRGSSQKRKPAGAPIPDFYPAAITADQFYAAQEAGKARRVKGGRPGKERVNVFSALLWDARTGGRMHLRHYSRGGRLAPYLAPYEADQQRAEHVSFPLDVFEGAVFDRLREIDPREVLPRADGAADAALALAGRRSDIDARLAKLKSRMKGEEELDTLIELARELEADGRRVDAELAEARGQAAAPVADAWGEFKTVAEALASLPEGEREAGRVRLRGALRRMIESVYCLFMPGRGPRLAAVQIWFAGAQGRQRTFVFRYRQRHVTRSGHERAAGCDVVSAGLCGLRDGIDLRRPADAAAFEKFLAGIDVTDMGP